MLLSVHTFSGTPCSKTVPEARPNKSWHTVSHCCQSK